MSFFLYSMRFEAEFGDCYVSHLKILIDFCMQLSLSELLCVFCVFRVYFVDLDARKLVLNTMPNLRNQRETSWFT